MLSKNGVKFHAIKVIDFYATLFEKEILSKSYIQITITNLVIFSNLQDTFEKVDVTTQVYEGNYKTSF